MYAVLALALGPHHSPQAARRVSSVCSCFLSIAAASCVYAELEELQCVEEGVRVPLLLMVVVVEVALLEVVGV